MYRFLKIVCRFTVLGYFRKVKVEGRSNIPLREACIFVANHPSAFMDPIVVATSIQPSVYFLAAGEYMGKGFKYWFMHHFLHMIPVYRPETMPGKTFKNEAIFEKCIAHLQAKKSILVFPEGASVTEKKVSPLKTGVARIAGETVRSRDKETKVYIIPIGLNYTDPHHFRSDLYVKIGKPIIANSYFSGTEADQFEEARQLTAEIESRLIDTVLHIENTEFETLLSKVNATYTRDLKSDLKVNYSEQHREFEINKTLVEAMSHFQKIAPEKLAQLESQLDDYLAELAGHRIKDKDFRNRGRSIKASQWLFLIFTFPLFLVGFLFNWLPYRFSGFIRKKIKTEETFSGSITLAVGLVVFALWYALLTSISFLFSPLSYYSFLLPPLFYLSGIFSLIYRDIFTYFKRRWRVNRLKRKEFSVFQQLQEKRDTLIQQFEQLREDYEVQQ